MKYICLLLAILFCTIQTANAAFRCSGRKSFNPGCQYVLAEAGRNWQLEKSNTDAQHYRHNIFRLSKSNPDDRYSNATEGMVSLTCAIFSAVCFMGASLTAFSLFLIPAFIFAVAAVVFGIVGMKRRKRGFAILGMVLGLIEIVAGFAILAQL